MTEGVVYRVAEKTMVSVPIEVVQELYELKGRVSAFAEWVKQARYSLDRGDCAAILGFEIPQEEKNE